MPGGGIEPPTRGFSIETAEDNTINTISYMNIKLVCAKVCFSYCLRFGSNTVSRTNGGTQYLEPLNHTKISHTA